MTQLTCPSCGNEEPEGSRFCGACGAAFAAAEQPVDEVDTVGEKTLTCPSCGNEEPEGSRFCGSCAAPLAPAEPVLAAQEPASEVTAESFEVESAPGSPVGRKRLSWVAGAAVAVLLVAGGTVAALLLRSDGDSSEAATTAPAEPATTSGVAPSTTPTLAESIAPSFQVLAASQNAVGDRVRSLRPGVESFAALHDAATSLAASVGQAQGVVDRLSPGDATETETLALLRGALVAHLAYAEALSGFPRLPRDLTDAQARAAIALAEEAQRAYATLAFADPGLPSIHVSTADNAPLLAVVAAPKPTTSPPLRHTIDLVPLLAGVRPDDPPSEGRCFGPYTSRASLRVSGVTYRSGFIQCGDDADGDPSRASGVYRFAGRSFPTGSRLVRLTGQVAIDESSSAAQRGSSVTWTVFYDGAPICSVTGVWSGSRPSPRRLDCKIPSSAASGGFDIQRLRIQQVASLASSGSLWAGLLDPTIVVEVPS